MLPITRTMIWKMRGWGPACKMTDVCLNLEMCSSQSSGHSSIRAKFTWRSHSCIRLLALAMSYGGSGFDGTSTTSIISWSLQNTYQRLNYINISYINYLYGCVDLSVCKNNISNSLIYYFNSFGICVMACAILYEHSPQYIFLLSWQW